MAGCFIARTFAHAGRERTCAQRTIEGGGHTWPGEDVDFWRRAGAASRDIDASGVMLDFFLRQPKAEH